eukprot:TRINITY_DN140_c0_g2_i1.p1 TRINITY_DN140_c0_g2~~TRINITY_DN140_c0_g2_i1.p1  ORF type:complete len:1188 (-),score=429.06 TRINITY_DN140_c0_g2_i1:99-3662(-)
MVSLQRQSTCLIACGLGTSAAATDMGSVYVWGAAAIHPQRDAILPREVFELKNQGIVEISCGWSHFAVVNCDGACITWGLESEKGMLGHVGERRSTRATLPHPPLSPRREIGSPRSGTAPIGGPGGPGGRSSLRSSSSALPPLPSDREKGKLEAGGSERRRRRGLSHSFQTETPSPRRKSDVSSPISSGRMRSKSDIHIRSAAQQSPQQSHRRRATASRRMIDGVDSYDHELNGSDHDDLDAHGDQDAVFPIGGDSSASKSGRISAFHLDDDERDDVADVMSDRRVAEEKHTLRQKDRSDDHQISSRTKRSSGKKIPSIPLDRIQISQQKERRSKSRSVSREKEKIEEDRKTPSKPKQVRSASKRRWNAIGKLREELDVLRALNVNAQKEQEQSEGKHRTIVAALTTQIATLRSEMEKMAFVLETNGIEVPKSSQLVLQSMEGKEFEQVHPFVPIPFTRIDGSDRKKDPEDIADDEVGNETDETVVETEDLSEKSRSKVSSSGPILSHKRGVGSREIKSIESIDDGDNDDSGEDQEVEEEKGEEEVDEGMYFQPIPVPWIEHVAEAEEKEEEEEKHGKFKGKKKADQTKRKQQPASPAPKTPARGSIVAADHYSSKKIKEKKEIAEDQEEQEEREEEELDESEDEEPELDTSVDRSKEKRTSQSSSVSPQKDPPPNGKNRAKPDDSTSQTRTTTVPKKEGLTEKKPISTKQHDDIEEEEEEEKGGSDHGMDEEESAFTRVEESEGNAKPVKASEEEMLDEEDILRIIEDDRRRRQEIEDENAALVARGQDNDDDDDDDGNGENGDKDGEGTGDIGDEKVNRDAARRWRKVRNVGLATLAFRKGGALHEAAANGDDALIVRLLSRGLAVDEPDESGRTPLHFASACGHAKVMRVLLDRGGANANARDDESKTPLHAAVSSGDVHAVTILLDSGATISPADMGGATPIHYAALVGCANCMQLLLARGTDVDVKDDVGRTPLHLAVHSGHLESVRALLSFGAGVNAHDATSCTPLHYAAAMGHIGIAEVLLTHGAILDVKDRRGSEPLHFAAGQGKRGVLSLLILSGASVLSSDHAGRTPLHYSCIAGNIACTEELISHGSEINRTDDRGWAPIHYAFKEGHGEVFSLLIQKGADQSGLDRVEAELGVDDHSLEYADGTIMDLNTPQTFSKGRPKSRKKRSDSKGACVIQ